MLQEATVTESFDIAFRAKSKLGKAVSKSEQNLRLMVGHANLLDGLMEELNEIECVATSATASGKQTRDDSRDVVEELVPDSEDDTSNDELSEAQGFEFEELSLTRWPSNAPTRLPLLEPTESQPHLQSCGSRSRRRSQQYLHTVESIAEEDGDDDELSQVRACDEFAGILDVAPRFSLPSALLEVVPRVESSRPHIAVQVVEVTACQ